MSDETTAKSGNCSKTVVILRRGGRVVEGASLENWSTGNRTGGSNPSLSAIAFVTWHFHARRPPSALSAMSFCWFRPRTLGLPVDEICRERGGSQHVDLDMG